MLNDLCKIDVKEWLQVSTRDYYIKSDLCTLSAQGLKWLKNRPVLSQYDT